MGENIANRIAVITDSASDLGSGIRKKYGIEYVAMGIHFDGKDLKASLDWEEISPVEMYGIMRSGTRITTTQVPVHIFREEFERHLKNGEDVLYIGCSSGLSGSVNAGKVVGDELQKEYPENKIICIDSLSSCLAEGLIAVDAAMMRDEGKSIDEIAAYIEKNKLKYNQYAAIEDLSYLKRAGRVKASAAFFGNMFGIKPILISNRNGENFAVKKIKGRKSSLDEIVNMAVADAEDAEKRIIGIAHADCEEDAEYVKAKIKERLNPKEIYVNYIGPIIGASAGPGSIAVYLYGKEVTV